MAGVAVDCCASLINVRMLENGQDPTVTYIDQIEFKWPLLLAEMYEIRTAAFLDLSVLVIHRNAGGKLLFTMTSCSYFRWMAWSKRES